MPDTLVKKSDSAYFRSLYAQCSVDAIKRVIVRRECELIERRVKINMPRTLDGLNKEQLIEYAMELSRKENQI